MAEKHLLGPGHCFCSQISVLLTDTFPVSLIFLAYSKALVAGFLEAHSLGTHHLGGSMKVSLWLQDYS